MKYGKKFMSDKYWGMDSRHGHAEASKEAELVGTWHNLF
jgi:hypothetical protein